MGVTESVSNPKCSQTQARDMPLNTLGTHCLSILYSLMSAPVPPPPPPHTIKGMHGVLLVDKNTRTADHSKKIYI